MSSPRRKDPTALLPLKPVFFHVLLVLGEEERHGYSIVKALEADADSGLRVDPGNLYRSLRTMLDQGLIAETDRRRDPDLDDERRRYFAITPFGREVAAAEAHRLERLVRVARKQRLLVR